MATDPDSGLRFQFSLRTFLIASCALGLTLGGFGHLYVRSPSIFLELMTLTATVLPFLLAIGTILWIGWRSPRRRWGLIAWGGVLLLIPPIGIGVLSIAHQRLSPSPSNLQFQSTQQLIQLQLPTRINEPWVWNELESRLKAGTLSQQDVDDAVKRLTLHMTTTQPNGWNQPLPYQNRFIKAAAQSGKISEPVLLKLCDAFYGPKPVIRPLPRLREETKRFHAQLQWGHIWAEQASLGVEFLWQVNRVLLDGEPISVRETSKNGWNWTGYCDGRLPAGDHKLIVEVECAYIDQSKLMGLSASDLPKSRWPKARKRWTQTVSAPLKVYSSDVQLVSLTTDVSRSPGPTGGIRIGRLAVHADRDGRKSLVLKSEFSKELSVSLSYDVAVSIHGQLTKLGPMWSFRYPNGSSQSGNHLAGPVDVLDPSITQADLILTPNPVHVEQFPDVTEIWGKTTILRNVPLERLDLEPNQGIPSP